MNATQLEELVLRAVDAVRAGAKPEDDRIEFKRVWPELDKVRQLAAAANQAQGEHIIYVIGVDEKDGSLHPVDGVDPATWWQRFESRFDEIAPDLALHINVYVETGEQIVALLFRTDRAPYVIKVQNDGAVEREVPIRAGAVGAVPRIAAVAPPQRRYVPAERLCHATRAARAVLAAVRGRPQALVALGILDCGGELGALFGVDERRLGHSSITVSADLYGHLIETAARADAEAAALIRRAREAPKHPELRTSASH